MFNFLFKAAGTVVLALALVAAVLDVTRSIAASSVVITPFGSAWASLSPSTLESARASVVEMVHPFVWNPVIVFFLALPAWLLLFTIALIFLWIGQKRENPYGRFAAR